MDARELADLTTVLFIAAGSGLALACAFLVRKPAPRTFRVWAGATAVAIPGLLVGWIVVHPQLGARSVYRGLTAVLQEPLTLNAQIPVFPRPVVEGSASPRPTASGAPSLAPSAGVSRPAVNEEPEEVEGVDPTTEAPPPVTTTAPPSMTTTAPPPSSPPPSPTEPSPTPTPTDSPTPTPSPTETPAP